MALAALAVAGTVAAACGSGAYDDSPTPSADPARTPAGPIMVTSADDSGPGTLRTAISQAQDERNRPGADLIRFDLEAMGSATIRLASQLPDIVSTIEIDGAGRLVLVGGGTRGHRHFYIAGRPEPGHLTLRGLTLTRGGGAGTGSGRGGAAFNDGGTLTIIDSVVSDSTASASGGIRNSGTLTIRNSTLSGNGDDLGCAGGAVDNKSGGTALIEGTRVLDNTADVGGGVVNDGGTMTIRDAQFSGNTALDWGGGGILNHAGGTMTIVDTTVVANRATTGGGLANTGALTMERVVFTANRAESGGAIANFEGGTLTVTDSTISGNTGEDGAGAILNGSVVEIIKTEIRDNEGVGSGAIYNAGSMRLEASFVDGNRGGREDEATGEVVIGSGGAVASHGLGTELLIINSILSNNRATGAGGALFAVGARVGVVGSTFIANRAEAGGALAAIGGAVFTVVNTTMRGNEAEFGGAISLWSAGRLEITSCTIEGNRAGAGGAILAADGSEIAALNITVSGNEADTGGALYALSGATVAVISGTVADNAAGTIGGVLEAESGEIRLVNSIVAGSRGPGCAGGWLIGGHGNLTSDPGCAEVDGFVLVVDLGIGELAAHGGETETHALLEGSPAIDAVPLAVCADGFGEPLFVDQRAFARPRGEACDAGAFEY